jgi:hypothetical protein
VILFATAPRFPVGEPHAPLEPAKAT